TQFPMKADLAKREPEILSRWAEGKLYARILEARKGARPYVLHDGPPYANGNIHYGHILNKILKDIVCKYRTMAGHYVEYKPGWDCHGLPIELAVQRSLGDKIAGMSAVEIRAACHDYAMKWVGVQRDEFIRLGVFGTWDDPYLTLSKHYEATIVRQLAEFARKGMLYQAKKPVHWCMSDKTALAEAEIEYDEAHVSPSIYVKFATPEAGLSAVIWTTTPWTLPANWAVAYHPTFEYVTMRANGERLIVAKELADKVVEACKLVEDGPREPFAVENFVRLHAARHPFLDRQSRFVPADYVTLEQGTGLVHTAPGHGADDFVTGKKYDLPVDAPVDDGGKFSSGPWKGEFVFKANPKIVALLADKGALLSPPNLSVTHAYPICWRCKNPVIFRATEQLFARMDGETQLRQTALAEIKRTQWIPPWGENRIAAMIENRPDWVLSRQRVWGVPIPVFYAPDGAAVIDADLMDKVAERFEKDGADAWFASSTGELLGSEHAALNKGNDIVDVWFESGVSWAAVCEGEKSVGLDSSTAEDRRPIDLYLEGSDQHRGWFHSSLLASCATRGRSPYRAVLTHGFVLDDKGRPYSKSDIERRKQAGEKVEFIPPPNVIKESGAELLRMWTAQADFRSDIMYSRAHLTQLGESYRKLRNTMRFLLGNLGDFDPTKHLVKDELADFLDRHVYARAADLEATIKAAYDAFELHVVLRALVDFCNSDLSALYLDVRKDRLYCDPAGSPERRATQTVLYRCLRVVTTALAPICCFTAEEIWSYMPKLGQYDPDSVHLALLGAGERQPPEDVAKMGQLLELRARVQKELEPFRAQKKSSLDAHVTITVSAADAELIGRMPQGWLADFLIVSQTTVRLGAEPSIVVGEATGNRCERCWKWTPEPPPLCARCKAAVASIGG
ncbi:MAG TPA: isoleucine--tRNA ligase, partial [Polyangia bacterium]